MTSRHFSVELTAQAKKDLKRLCSWTERVSRAIPQLELDPLRGHPLTGSLRGARALEFSLPGGAYRAVYVILEETQVCLVFLIGPHEGIYQRAERRYEALRRRGWQG